MNKDIKVLIKVLDHNGDTQFERELQAAIEEIAKQKFKFGKWPYVNGEYFQFSAAAMEDTKVYLQDCARLHDVLSNVEKPVVVMTAELVGGAQ